MGKIGKAINKRLSKGRAKRIATQVKTILNKKSRTKKLRTLKAKRTRVKKTRHKFA